MKWTDKKTVLSLGTAIVIFLGVIIKVADSGLDFWEEHIRAEASEVPDGVVIAPRQKIIADAEYYRINYDSNNKAKEVTK